MVALAKRVFVQAALVGLDGVETESGADAIIELQATIEDGRRMPNVLPMGPELLDRMNRALDAKRELPDDYCVPSLERRRRLLASSRAGAVPESELPHDLFMLIADGGPGLEGQDVVIGMAMQLLQGAVGTNTSVLVDALAELTEWFALHPDDIERRGDSAFLEGAVKETIRLHSSNALALSRVALEDVTLSTGRSIPAGQHVALLQPAVARDEAAFGADAARSNPRRVVPTGVYPFGLGFGSGVHMCIGLPLVLGQGGISGMQVPFLQALYAAGVRTDPAKPAEKRAELLPWRVEYANYPVVFDQRG